MHVILLNTVNRSAFEMRFSNEKQMKKYLKNHTDTEFLSFSESYLPTRHQRMQ